MTASGRWKSLLMRKPRPQSLADVEAMIAEAEEVRDLHRGFLQRAGAAGLSLRRGQNLLRQAGARLAQLYRSHEALLRGGQPPQVGKWGDTS
jgi:hypothetical protein